jgi:hypothetical protein
MTLSGWIFMLGSLTAVVSLAAFCYRRVLTAKRDQSPR